MKKLFIFLLTFYALFVTWHRQAQAHVGGGPPFLVVDGVYAATNPYFYADPTINIPQDYTGKTYLVNKPIHLFVDTDKLLVPPDIAKASTFRWTMQDLPAGRQEADQYKFGQTLDYTYTKPGSYIITLEVKAPGETEYTVIDTVQLDVLPNQTYKLPTATMSVATDHGKSTKPIFFQSTYGVDRSTKVASIIWGFGDGTTSTKQNVLHTYTQMQDYSTFPIIFRVTDANGFRGYAGIILVANKGTLQFVNNLGQEGTIQVKNTLPSTTETTSQQNKNPGSAMLWPIVIGAGIIILVLIIVVVVVMKKRKK